MNDQVILKSSDIYTRKVIFTQIFSSQISSILLKLSSKGLIPDASYSHLALQYGSSFAGMVFIYDFCKKNISSN